MLPLKSSRNEYRSVIVFLWAKKKYCKSDASSIWRQSVLQSEQFTFVVRKCWAGKHFVSYTEVQSVVLQWHGQQPAGVFFASGIQMFADR